MLCCWVTCRQSSTRGCRDYGAKGWGRQGTKTMTEILQGNYYPKPPSSTPVFVDGSRVAQASKRLLDALCQQWLQFEIWYLHWQIWKWRLGTQVVKELCHDLRGQQHSVFFDNSLWRGPGVVLSGQPLLGTSLLLAVDGERDSCLLSALRKELTLLAGW